MNSAPNGATGPDVGGAISMIEGKATGPDTRSRDRKGRESRSAVHLIGAGQDTCGRDGDQWGAAHGLSNGSGGLWEGGGVVITSDKYDE